MKKARFREGSGKSPLSAAVTHRSVWCTHVSDIGAGKCGGGWHGLFTGVTTATGGGSECVTYVRPHPDSDCAFTDTDHFTQEGRVGLGAFPVFDWRV